MPETLVYRIASALDPTRPIMWIMEIAGVAHSTAKTWAYGSKSWAYGNRRPPIEALKNMQAALRDALPEGVNQKLLLELDALLKAYIWEREREPAKPRSGFNEIRERDGPGSIPRDGRNRLGRPKRTSAST
jgi:hypothetical protein